jgi:nitric oxide reductase NorQ protein
MNDLTIERIPSSEFRPKPDIKYVDVFGLMSLFEGLAYRAPTVLVGPKGVGKTLSLQAFALREDVPIITFDCSEDVRRAHLLGMQVLRGDQTPFILGPLTTAFEVANETGKCILALEEINALSPQMQKVLNAPLDWRRRIEVPECRRVFRLKDGAKLWITGTMNQSVYGGVYQLNEDLKSRVRLITLDYPKPSKEKELVDQVLVTKPDKKLIDNVLLLAHETRQKALDYALSTRDVIQVLEDMVVMGQEPALRIVLGKFEDSDRDTVRERITSIFGLQPSQAA